MAKKEFPLFDGQLIIVVDEKFEPYEKDVPEGWLYNFGLRLKENKGRRELKGRVPKYQILVADEPDKNLFYLDYSTGEVSMLEDEYSLIWSDGQRFRVGTIDIGDPPIAWD